MEIGRNCVTEAEKYCFNIVSIVVLLILFHCNIISNVSDDNCRRFFFAIFLFVMLYIFDGLI